MSLALAKVETLFRLVSSPSLLTLFHRWFRASPPLPERIRSEKELMVNKIRPSSVFKDLFFISSF